MAKPAWNDDRHGRIELNATLNERDAFVRFETDTGPGTAMLKDTVAIFDVRARITFPTTAHKLRFREFYIQDLKRGSEPFTWTNPITGRPADFRFRTAPNWFLAGAYTGGRSSLAPGGDGSGVMFIEVDLIMVDEQ